MQAHERPIAKIIELCSETTGIFSRLSEQQRKVLNQVSACRTERMSLHVYRCENEECNHTTSRYASCKNRACSVCSWLPREKWKLQRMNDLIPRVPYYHNVFTIPHIFSRIASQNQVVVQTLLFKAVSETLKAFEASHCRGGKIGFLAVLHTWSTRMLQHYHIHCAIPGGYVKNDKWHDMSKYLFPARALAEMFRNKMCSGLRKLKRDGKLEFRGSLSDLNDAKIFSKTINEGYNKKWYVHVERTQGKDPSRIMGYLANYVYKTAIDHSRISCVNESEVTFSHRSHEDGERGEWKSLTLAPEEFLGRYCDHIQPSRFMRLRYYGFLGGGVKKKYLEMIFEQKESHYNAINQQIHLSSCESIVNERGKSELYACPLCSSQVLSPWEYYRRFAGLDPPKFSGIRRVLDNETLMVCA